MATILLVDDDLMVTELCYRFLIDRGGGYVLPAGSGSQAIDLAVRYTGVIELLLSDTSMPGGMSGIELAEQLTLSRPGIKVLLMSGLSSRDFVLASSWRFLAKPFHPLNLISSVGAILAVSAPSDEKRIARPATFPKVVSIPATKRSAG
jgi:two-component system cell cycle response regulator CpdR